MSSGQGQQRWALAIHGGAGVINADNQEWLDATAAGLAEALSAGVKILEEGGSALDAVVCAVRVMEENPRFNAGRGSVLTLKGRHELEATVMTDDKHCGGVTLVKHVRNPILLARAVMEHTPHVLLGGEEAEAFAKEQGLELVDDNSWFTTEQRKQQWVKYTQRGELPRGDEIIQHGTGAAGRAGPAGAGGPGGCAVREGGGESDHAQTVGAVAIDCNGRLAAATSTGGRCGKYDGRIGDTAVNGAGNWADTRTALSGTGIGEEFLRRAACHDVAARVAYGGATLGDAMRAVVFDDFAPGDGGFIGVGSDYSIEMEFNSQGMSRACADYSGRREVAIFK